MVTTNRHGDSMSSRDNKALLTTWGPADTAIIPAGLHPDSGSEPAATLLDFVIEPDGLTVAVTYTLPPGISVDLRVLDVNGSRLTIGWSSTRYRGDQATRRLRFESPGCYFIALYHGTTLRVVDRVMLPFRRCMIAENRGGLARGVAVALFLQAARLLSSAAIVAQASTPLPDNQLDSLLEQGRCLRRPICVVVLPRNFTRIPALRARLLGDREHRVLADSYITVLLPRPFSRALAQRLRPMIAGTSSRSPMAIYIAPSGRPLHRAICCDSTQENIVEQIVRGANDALRCERQYFTLRRRYQQGDRYNIFLGRYALAATRAGACEARTIARRYKTTIRTETIIDPEMMQIISGLRSPEHSSSPPRRE